ncbi:hypothetical protein Tsubulata_007015 [Turnera subulata]|uniref:Translation initiation factor 3 N-terminal domain-containing protein n=1 Tax=Turnera subulata TaxID=218843 RepID=A0A9Q0F2M7_9ROSI|nr:hypothetical protein Tsubulata_007015 [Turnera subulata]
MAFLGRANQSRLKLLTQQFKRHYDQFPPLDSALKYGPRASSISSVAGNPVPGFCRGPTEFCYNNVRFFAAATFQFQRRVTKEENDTTGPRLNDQIRAQYVRLVSDEGHCIVSLGEALQRAKKLEVDLVEVQRNADPPVCKLMNFSKEMYLREQKAKELAKSKAGVTLRAGSYKEVRFAEKTEEKDLKMKADTVIRLMERGYRVKCVALSSQKQKKGPGPSDEDEVDNGLGAVLSRLTSLIEDVAVVESGPRLEKRQAYAIVRHVKFGPAKKGAAKKPKTAAKVTVKPAIASGPASSGSYAAFEEDDGDFGMATEDEITSEEDDVPDKNPVDVKRADSLPSSPLQPSFAAENRYERNEPRTQFPPTTPTDNRMDRRTPSRGEPQFSNQNRPPQAPTNPSHLVRERQQAGAVSSSPRNVRQPPNIAPNPPSPSDPSRTPSSGYGIFSSPVPNTPGKPSGASEVNKTAEANRYSNPKSNINNSQRVGATNGGQGRWGAFSRDDRNVNPGGVSKPN